MPTERWKTTTININYQVSTFGNVRSIEREITRSDGKVKRFKAKHLKAQRWVGGYLFVTISQQKIGQRQYSIHRLVALSWRSNPLNHPQVNHKDGNKENNYYTNLEWCTQGENNAHSYRTGLKIHHKCWKGKTGYNHNRSKEVIEYDSKSKKVTNKYGSASEAARQLGVSSRTMWDWCKYEKKNKKNKTYKYG